MGNAWEMVGFIFTWCLLGLYIDKYVWYWSFNLILIYIYINVGKRFGTLMLVNGMF